MSHTSTTPTTAVIGAGPAGLSVARALRRFGVSYDQFERHTDVGGVWDLDNPGTPMYESAHFISSRGTSGFYDYPMPETFPDYPNHRQILSYTRQFAADFGLTERVELGRSVTKVERSGDGWDVSLDDRETRHYDAVVCASGTTWTPRVPDYPGHFTGEVRHSSTYRSRVELAGKRVLIVGLGNSAADIACDAADSAAATFVSARRGYHFLPKHLLGRPIDELGRGGPQLPIRLERLVLAGLLRLHHGDLTRYGLPKPDHRLFESHPLLNSQLIHHLQHGDVAMKGAISHFAGGSVHFTDGSSERVDLVLYATGFEWSLPYASRDHFSWDRGRPEFYLSAFNRTSPSLLGLGFLDTNSSAYTLFDHVSFMVAQYLRDRADDPRRAAELERLAREDRRDLTGGISFVDSDRHVQYVDARTFKRHLRRVSRQLGWEQLAPGAFDGLAVREPVAG